MKKRLVAVVTVCAMLFAFFPTYGLETYAAESTADSSLTTSSSTSVSTSATQSTTTAAQNYIEITGDVVNVRAGAGTEYKRISTVKQGQRYKIYATKTVNGSKWYKIKVNNKDGWIISTYTKLVDTSVATTTTTAAQPQYIEVTEKSVNVRAGAGTHCKILGTVKLGQRYKYYATKMYDGEKWYKIKFKDADGWLAASCVKLVDSAVTTTTAKPTTTTTTTTTTASSSSVTTSSQVSGSTDNSTTSSTAAPAANEYVEITVDALNVRAGAGTNYKIIATVKRGQRYKFFDTKTVDGALWYKIKVNGKLGWIIHFVKEVNSGVTTTTTKMATTSTKASTSASTTTTTKVTTAAPKTHIEITGKSVYVRAGAGTNHKIVSAVKRGEKYKFSATKTVNGVKWYKITVKGVTGWVIGTYAKEYSVATTTKKTTTTTAKASYVVITGSVVNVRSGAGTNYGVVASVKKGQKLQYSAVKTVNKTTWYKIKVNGKTGWVVGTYAKVSK